MNINNPAKKEMKKNIKDYLRYYLGCPCIMTRNSYHAVHQLRLSADSPFTLTGQLCDYFSDLTTKAVCKPLLRPLSSMTKEEGIELLGNLYKDLYFNEADLQYVQIADSPADSFGMVAKEVNFSERLGFTIEPHRGIELSLNSQQVNVPQFEITRTLLLKYFDLFGLIAEGLAIDATTLTEKTDQP